MREAEIARLGEEAARRGANADAVALQHRCEAQEGLILRLTEQVALLRILATTTWRCLLTCQPCQTPRAWHGSLQRTVLGLRDN